MCGISAIFGRDPETPGRLDRMVASQSHRGPDAQGVYESPTGLAGLGHNRLSIIDLSDAGRQPMRDASGRYWIVFNGEIYNYLELRAELEGSYTFRTRTDTEVLLAACLKWGEACLDRLIGMFAFVIWDETNRKAFGARDCFGVKPLHYSLSPDGGLWLASEIKALHAAGVPRRPDDSTWATYLVSGMYDHSESTFWDGIRRIPPGSCFTWTQERGLSIRKWYDVAKVALADGLDTRSDDEVADELLSLLEETVRLRFRSDVPVGICLSGGLDSSLLLGLVHRVQGLDSTVKTFTFYCGDPAYDEIPWVEQMLAKTKHPACYCRLTVDEVPALFDRVARHQDEPFGGLPTLGMAKVHERAVQEGVVVLLDGNGLDEGWAGYEYYQRAASVDASQAPVQGSRHPSTRPDCLNPDFAALSQPLPSPISHLPSPISALQALQYRDICFAKIPRAMRFADRISMMYSRELREPFLDRRIIELGLRQPQERKIRNGQGKWLVRRLAERLLSKRVCEAPKRPVQTPQREWLRGPLQPWLRESVEAALAAHPNWFAPSSVLPALTSFTSGQGDNSNFVWQWISLGLTADPVSNHAQRKLPQVSQNNAVREGNAAVHDRASAVMIDFDPVKADSAMVRLWCMGDQPGSPVHCYEEKNLLVVCFGDCRLAADGIEQLSAGWMRRALDQPERFKELSGVFALFVVDKCKREILVVTDRIGVQPVYYRTDPAGKILFSTHLSWLLLETRHDISVNQDDFFTQMAFGYVPDQSRTIYRGVAKLPPASCARVSAKGLRFSRYWEQPVMVLPLTGQVEDLSDMLRRDLLRSGDRHRLMLGLTSGKDSLCLACHMPRGETLTGSFGAADSADQLQAEKICLEKGWQTVKAGLCPPAQIERWLSYVGFHSGGLATASYADMAWFAATCMPKDCSYVMGEGGECVRDFFSGDGLAPIEQLSKEYMTPREYLNSVMASNMQSCLKDYPTSLIESMQSACGKTTGEAFALQFYRMVRMPGNFSQRHAVIATIRPKLSPFLSTNFIDLAYGLDPIHYRDSQLHRAIIAHSDPSLLRHFDFPVVSSISVQDWPRRFSGETGLLIEELLVKHSAVMEDVFKPEGLRKLCAQTRSVPSRAIFLLLRIASFALCRAELYQRKSENLRLIRDGTRVIIQPPKENSEQT